MKLKLLLSVFLFAFALNTLSASFPVKRQAVKSENSEIIQVADTELETPAAAYMAYDKWVAVAFWFFLGLFAAHRWYAKKPAGWNILFILTLGGLGIWAIVDIINILTDNFQ